MIWSVFLLYLIMLKINLPKKQIVSTFFGLTLHVKGVLYVTFVKFCISHNF